MGIMDWLANIGERRRLNDEVASILSRAIDEAAKLPPTAAEQATLAAHVEALPPRQRVMVKLSAQGLTYRQIAARLGITDKVALRELSQATATLRMLE